MAKQFDVAQTKFEQNRQEGRRKKFFDTGGKELDRIDNQWDATFKRLSEIGDESAASVHRNDNAEEVEDVLKNWEEFLKGTLSGPQRSKSGVRQSGKTGW